MLTPATVIDRVAGALRLVSTNFSLSAGLPERSRVESVDADAMVPPASLMRRILAHPSAVDVDGRDRAREPGPRWERPTSGRRGKLRRRDWAQRQACPPWPCGCTTTRSRSTTRSSADSSPRRCRSSPTVPLTIVEPWGTDNAIWRLGDDLVVRLPRIAWATGQVSEEATWLPRLAPHLPVAVPEPVAVGEPAEGYPYPLGGAPVDTGRRRRARPHRRPGHVRLDLAEVVAKLQAVPDRRRPAGPEPGPPLPDYDEATRRAIDRAEPPDRRRRGHGGVGGGARGDALRRPAGLGPWRPRGELPRARRPALRHRRLGLGVRRRSRRRRAGRVVAAVHRRRLARRSSTPSTSTTPRSLRSRGAAINQACAALPYYLHTYPLIVERSWHKLAALGVPPRSAP